MEGNQITYGKMRYMGAHVPGSGISWSRPFWETILIFYWVPSLSSCSLSASEPAALEAGCFLEKTNTLSKTDEQLHRKDLLPRTWHIDTGYNRTVQFCCVWNFYSPPPLLLYFISSTMESNGKTVKWVVSKWFKLWSPLTYHLGQKRWCGRVLDVFRKTFWHEKDVDKQRSLISLPRGSRRPWLSFGDPRILGPQRNLWLCLILQMRKVSFRSSGIWPRSFSQSTAMKDSGYWVPTAVLFPEILAKLTQV